MALDSFDDIRDAVRLAGGLASTTEVARVLGVTRQRVGQLSRQTGFPDPMPGSRHRLWMRDEIVSWQARRTYPGR